MGLLDDEFALKNQIIAISWVTAKSTLDLLAQFQTEFAL